MPMAQNDRTKSNPSILGVRFCLFSGICFVVFILIFVSVDSNAVKIRHYLHNYKKRNNDNEEDFSANIIAKYNVRYIFCFYCIIITKTHNNIQYDTYF